MRHEIDDILGQAASNRLESPSQRVVEATRLPQNDRSDDPCPEDLPENRGPPFPTSTTLDLDLVWRSVDFGTLDAEGGVELFGYEEHDDG